MNYSIRIMVNVFIYYTPVHTGFMFLVDSKNYTEK